MKNSDLVTFRQRETSSETFIYLMDLHQTDISVVSQAGSSARRQDPLTQHAGTQGTNYTHWMPKQY